jgi:hypothetical protein
VSFPAHEEPDPGQERISPDDATVAAAADAPATPAAREGTLAGGGMRASDRVIIFGQSGSGKSVVANHLFSQIRCQRLIWDSKDEYVVPGVEPVTRVGDIDWRQPIIHVIDEDGDLEDVNRLFRACLARRAGRGGGRDYGIVVLVHEAGDLCADNPGKTPRYAGAYARKGRAHNQGLIACTQRPVNFPKSFRSEAQHVIVMCDEFDADDWPIVARVLGRPERELRAQVDQIRERYPKHAYIWRNNHTGKTVLRPPLPVEALHRSVVRELGSDA